MRHLGFLYNLACSFHFHSLPGLSIMPTELQPLHSSQFSNECFPFPPLCPLLGLPPLLRMQFPHHYVAVQRAKFWELDRPMPQLCLLHFKLYDFGKLLSFSETLSSSANGDKNNLPCKMVVRIMESKTPKVQ